MIRKVPYTEIDFEKYTACLETSCNYRIYAEKWYLDILTDKRWDCLVYKDYEAIMPLPYIRKLGIKIVSQPIFCQQLGVFYKEEITKECFEKFEKELHRRLVLNYQFNEENTETYSPKGIIKDNHLVNLNKDYQEIYKDFKKDRKKDIRRVENNYQLIINKEFKKNDFIVELILKYPKLKNFYKTNSFSNLLDGLIFEKKVIYYELLLENKIISSIFLIKSHHRNILVLSSRDTSNLFKGAFAFLLNHFIKENSSTNLILDFEGSMIKNIATFNESFGAKKHLYTMYKNIPKYQKFKIFGGK